MTCVRLLDGTDVMTTTEHSLWRDELRRRGDGVGLCDALRRHLAKRMLLQNFRQLTLAGEHGMLEPESLCENAECLTAIKRQYVEAASDEADGVATCMDLLQAAERGDTQEVIDLLEKPHDPNAACRNTHATPLLYASAGGHLEVVECLLDAGADKEKANNEGTTPLHVAAFLGHQAIVQCLMDAGADKDRADNEGRSPLHLAAMQGHRTVVRCLVDAGAKANNVGRSPLQFAAMQGHQAVLQCLLDA
ncbi:unnamed protein product [Effrenium voratum]|nr:unnamed protein product [Effrenium voratum]